MRWKIETFHKILKSSCKVEESRLRTADRLADLIAVLRPKLAHILTHNARPLGAAGPRRARVHTHRN
ncbi:hypothetical protein BN2476_630125 [Paraburkholderia piptadeniae]|uniref:Transposase IS4-like domain-containing protein n=2 Tax=Paraburkholderia TaxID=1822464 RepID=A0A7X1TH08_9BURK|nr:hypothetical protein [Paraburkholderia franconis]SIT48337.1 hypothetical protein BN2476_630125 [Paraburkholderia piptadeniae]